MHAQGKLDTEKLLGDSGINWTSIRPVYIYGELHAFPPADSHIPRWEAVLQAAAHLALAPCCPPCQGFSLHKQTGRLGCV